MTADVDDVRDVNLPFSIVASGTIRAEVATSALFAAQRRTRDKRRDGHEARAAPSLVVERRTCPKAIVKLGLLLVQHGDCIAQGGALAEQAHGLPHQLSDVSLV